jgi:hypothetical protein
MNVQVIADAFGRLLGASPALPGAVHDIKAARTPRHLRSAHPSRHPDVGRQGISGSSGDDPGALPGPLEHAPSRAAGGELLPHQDPSRRRAGQRHPEELAAPAQTPLQHHSDDPVATKLTQESRLPDHALRRQCRGPSLMNWPLIWKRPLPGRCRARTRRPALGPTPSGPSARCMHAGKVITVVIEDTYYRVLHGEDELAVRPRKNLGPITRLYVKVMGNQKDRQGSPDDKPSRKS